MKYIIDRIEQDRVICETPEKEWIAIPASEIAGRLRDGAVIESREQGFIVLEDETAERTKKISAKFFALLKEKDKAKEKQ